MTTQEKILHSSFRLIPGKLTVISCIPYCIWNWQLVCQLLQYCIPSKLICLKENKWSSFLIKVLFTTVFLLLIYTFPLLHILLQIFFKKHISRQAKDSFPAPLCLWNRSSYVPSSLDYQTQKLVKSILSLLPGYYLAVSPFCWNCSY